MLSEDYEMHGRTEFFKIERTVLVHIGQLPVGGIWKNYERMKLEGTSFSVMDIPQFSARKKIMANYEILHHKEK